MCGRAIRTGKKVAGCQRKAEGVIEVGVHGSAEGS